MLYYLSKNDFHTQTLSFPFCDHQFDLSPSCTDLYEHWCGRVGAGAAGVAPVAVVVPGPGPQLAAAAVVVVVVVVVAAPQVRGAGPVRHPLVAVVVVGLHSALKNKSFISLLEHSKILHQGIYFVFLSKRYDDMT